MKSPASLILCIRSLTVFAVIVPVRLACSQVTFNPIGFMPGDTYSEVRSVNADGTKAVGNSAHLNSNNAREYTPIRWTADAGFVSLPFPPDDGSPSTGNPPFVTASDISGDGNWIAYRARAAGTERRVAMLSAGDGSNAISLGRLAPNQQSLADQVSDNGSVVFGVGIGADFLQHSFIWTAANGIQQLAEPSGFNFSGASARAISTDGSVSVGEMENIDEDGNQTAHQAYRWTAATGMQSIGVLPGGTMSAALAVSADGTKIFGVSNSANVPGNDANGYLYDGELFLWTAGGMTDLGGPPGYGVFSNFGGLSADGSVAACYIASPPSIALPPDTIVCQTATKTFFKLHSLLVAAGAGAAVDGWTALTTLGVSDDGNTLFGSGIDPNGNNQGWVAHFPPGYLQNYKQAASFTGIGFIAGDNRSEARAVTADGTKVVGESSHLNSNGFPVYSPIVWTSYGGFQLLPFPPDDGSPSTGNPPFVTASDISGNGNWIAYRARAAGTERRVAMLSAGDGSNAISLGRLAPNQSSLADQVSDNGSVVFGVGIGADFLQHSFIWTAANGIQQLAEPSGFNFSGASAKAVSTDGSVSVGEMENIDDDGNQTAHQAYRWTAATGMQSIGVLPGGTMSAAFAVSADGTKIFGVSNSANVPGNDANGYLYDGELFLWTAGGMTDLGGPAGYDVFNNFGGMSADGALIAVFAGSSTGAQPDDTFVGRVGTGGYFSLHDLLAGAGAAGSLQGWSELDALGMSDDGNVLYGDGTDPNGNTQGWIAQFPEGYLRTVQAFTPPAPNQPTTVASGTSVAAPGNYSSMSIQVSDGSGSAALVLSSGANLTVADGVSVGDQGTLSVSDNASVSAQSVTTDAGGTLSVDGTMTVTQGASINGTLTGYGVIDGSVGVGSTGTLSPGDPVGVLAITGDLTAQQGATIGFSLNGQNPGSDYTQVSVGGILDLTNQPTLDLTLGFTPDAGDAFTLISSQSIATTRSSPNGTRSSASRHHAKGTATSKRVVLSAKLLLSAADGSQFAGIPEGGIFTVGSVIFRATYNGNGQHDFVVTALDSFHSWEGKKFSSSELADPTVVDAAADPDSDGLQNLLEYAFNTDPEATSSVFRPTTIREGNNLSLVYHKYDFASDIVYTVEQSTDLHNWSPASPNNIIVADTGGVQTVKAQVPLNGATRLFLRVSVSL